MEERPARFHRAARRELPEHAALALAGSDRGPAPAQFGVRTVIIMFRDLLCAALLTCSAFSYGAEIKVVGGSAVIPVMNLLIPQFERASGHRVHADFDAAIGAVTERIEKGEPADVAI